MAKNLEHLTIHQFRGLPKYHGFKAAHALLRCP
ncbi:hypothetical protein PCC7418_1131 [Halothece sp. PCC 7418]|nr:hypothetical protein PCC7418_1131 [Halothece sp. PCC 7418]